MTSNVNSDNWALGMPATQSSIEWDKPALLAVDGDYNCGFDGSIAHTIQGDQYPWWMVDLETTIMVTAVALYNRIDCCCKCIGILSKNLSAKCVLLHHPLDNYVYDQYERIISRNTE